MVEKRLDYRFQENGRLEVLTNPYGSYSTCYVLKGNIVSSDLWGEEDHTWATGSDQDMTYYLTYHGRPMELWVNAALCWRASERRARGVVVPS